MRNTATESAVGSTSCPVGADRVPESASASACSTPSAHHVRAQGCDPRLDRGAAIRERDRRGRPVCESQQPLGIFRPPGQHTDPGAVDGERRILHQLVLTEPPEPFLHGLHPAVEVERQARTLDQVGDGARLARCVPVGDRFLHQIVGDAPGHRTTV